jgi:hypothetical protein
MISVKMKDAKKWQTGNRQFWDATMTIADFGYPVLALWCYCPKTLNYLAFQSFDFERT